MVRDTNKSKLVAKLRDISRGPVAPIGFGRAATPAALPALALAVDLARNDPALAETALMAGADAVVARLHAEVGGERFGSLAEERDRLAAILKRVANHKVVGVAVGANGELSDDDLKQLADLGVDFVVAQAHLAPAEMVRVQTSALVVRLDQDPSAEPLTGLNEVPIGAVWLKVSRPDGSLPRLTVHDIANYRQTVNSIRHPIIAEAAWALTPAEIAYLPVQGIEGLALTAEIVGKTTAEVQAKVGEYHTAITALGPPIGRERARGGQMAIVPSVARSQREEEDEEPDET